MTKKSKVFVGVSGGVDSSVALALLKNEGYDVTGVFLRVWHPEWLPCDWKEERRSAMRVCATLDVPFLTINCQKEYKILEGVDRNKDQSYFLYTLNQEQLSHTLFPVGGMTKPEVRKLARKFSLPTANKKDSQGLCFIGKVDMKDFLSHYIKIKRGNILNTKGEIVGFHSGAGFHTIGQRRGFTITKKSIKDPRFFVVSKNLDKNTITVANKEEEKDSVYSTKNISL